MPAPINPELFYVAYERFLIDVETLAHALERDSWRPDFLVGVGRGGLVPAAYLSHRTQIPMLSVDHSSGEAGFADELLSKLAAKSRGGTRILTVDDINDS
jgi:xanthine phosphoribosyltransferase